MSCLWSIPLLFITGLDQPNGNLYNGSIFVNRMVWMLIPQIWLKSFSWKGLDLDYPLYESKVFFPPLFLPELLKLAHPKASHPLLLPSWFWPQHIQFLAPSLESYNLWFYFSNWLPCYLAFSPMHMRMLASCMHMRMLASCTHVRSCSCMPVVQNITWWMA